MIKDEIDEHQIDPMRGNSRQIAEDCGIGDSTNTSSPESMIIPPPPPPEMEPKPGDYSPSEDDMKDKLPEVTREQKSRIKAQVRAYRLLSRNMPLDVAVLTSIGTPRALPEESSLLSMAPASLFNEEYENGDPEAGSVPPSLVVARRCSFRPSEAATLAQEREGRVRQRLQYRVEELRLLLPILRMRRDKHAFTAAVTELRELELLDVQKHIRAQLAQDMRNAAVLEAACDTSHFVRRAPCLAAADQQLSYKTHSIPAIVRQRMMQDSGLGLDFGLRFGAGSMNAPYGASAAVTAAYAGAAAAAAATARSMNNGILFGAGGNTRVGVGSGERTWRQDVHSLFLEAVLDASHRMHERKKEAELCRSRVNHHVLGYHNDAERRRLAKQQGAERERLRDLHATHSEEYVRLVREIKAQRMQGFQERIAKCNEAQMSHLTPQQAQAARARIVKGAASLHLQQYQLDGLVALAEAYERGRSVIVADELGLDKASMAAALLHHAATVCGDHGPFLIVAPHYELPVWARVLSRLVPQMPTLMYQGGSLIRHEMYQHYIARNSRPDVIVVATEESVFDIGSELADVPWSVMVVDEGLSNTHRGSAVPYAAHFRTRARTRVVLLNYRINRSNFEELWLFAKIVFPDVFADIIGDLGDWFTPSNSFGNAQNAVDDETGQISVAAQAARLSKAEIDTVTNMLGNMLARCVLRRTRAEVLADLRTVTTVTIRCRLTQLQETLYRSTCEQALMFLEEEEQTFLRHQEEQRQGGDFYAATLPEPAANPLIALLAICNHPFFLFDDYPIDNTFVTSCGKLDALDQVLSKMNNVSHRVLLCSRIPKVLDLLQQFLALRQSTFIVIDENTTGEQRDNALQAWNAPDSEYFVMILGVDANNFALHNVHTAIVYDIEWTPVLNLVPFEDQPVRIFRFVTIGTAEEDFLQNASAQAAASHTAQFAKQPGESVNASSNAAGKDSGTYYGQQQQADEYVFPASDNPPINLNLLEPSNPPRVRYDVIEQMLQKLQNASMPEMTDDVTPGQVAMMDTTDAEFPVAGPTPVFNYALARTEDELEVFQTIDNEQAEVARLQQMADEDETALEEERLLAKYGGIDEEDIDDEDEEEDDEEVRNGGGRNKPMMNNDLGDEDGLMSGLDAEQGLGAINPLPQQLMLDSSTQLPLLGVSEIGQVNPDNSSQALVGETGKRTRKSRGKRGRPSKASLEQDENQPGTGESKPRKRRRAQKNAAQNVFEGIDIDLLQSNIQSLFEAVFYAVDDYGRPLRATFMNLPSKKDMPQYYQVVRRPISLTDIETRKYLSERAFADDMRLLFSNAKLFYPPTSPIYADAVCLERVFEAQYNQLNFAVPEPAFPVQSMNHRPPQMQLQMEQVPSQEITQQASMFANLSTQQSQMIAPQMILGKGFMDEVEEVEEAGSVLNVSARFESFPDATLMKNPDDGVDEEEEDVDELLADDLDDDDALGDDDPQNTQMTQQDDDGKPVDQQGHTIPNNTNVANNSFSDEEEELAGGSIGITHLPNP